MKKTVIFVIDVYVNNHCYYENEGHISVYTEETIIDLLKRDIEHYAEVMFPKYYQASIKNRDDLDRYLGFTHDNMFLQNEWEFISWDDISETVTLRFEVEFYVPQDKKTAKSLERFTF